MQFGQRGSEQPCANINVGEGGTFKSFTEAKHEECGVGILVESPDDLCRRDGESADQVEMLQSLLVVLVGRDPSRRASVRQWCSGPGVVLIQYFEDRRVGGDHITRHLSSPASRAPC